MDDCPAEIQIPLCLSHPPIPTFGSFKDKTTANFLSNWFQVEYLTDKESNYSISGKKRRTHQPEWKYDSLNTTDEVLFSVANNLEDFSQVYAVFKHNESANYTCPKGFIFENTHNVALHILCSNWSWISEHFDVSKKCVGKF